MQKKTVYLLTNPALMKTIFSIISLLLLFSCQKKEDTLPAPEPVTATDTIDHGHNELTEDKGGAATPSDYNTDNPDVQIDRPEKSFIKTKLDTTLLFNIWTTDRNGPHADFELSSKSFYVADYDGNGDMPYLLLGRKLTVYYNDFVAEGEITFLAKDTLQIRWKGIDVDTKYLTWKDNK